MRKGSDILGKPVVAYETGEWISQVKDLIFDQDSNQLLGLLTREGGWFNDAEVIPFQSIQAIGSDAVIVPTDSALVRVSQLPEVRRILERNNILRGTHIMTTDGRNLGKMVDLYFDEQTGVIEGYEVSGGLFADAYSGRSYVPVPHTLKIGEHVAFVPSEVADLMEEQVGGIKAVMQTASEKVQSVAQTAGDRIQRAAQETGHPLQETGQTAKVSAAVISPAEQKELALGKISDWTIATSDGVVIVTRGQVVTGAIADNAERLGLLNEVYRATGGRVRDSLALEAGHVAVGYAVEQAKGHRVQQAVRLRSGLIVAAPGQIVTDTVIERAKLYQVEPELLNAVGLSTGDVLRYRASTPVMGVGNRFDSATQTFGTHLSEGTLQVRDGARTLWEQVKQTATDWQKRSVRTVEEQRIKSALGRPVTRVILDENDDVILNVGELITHQAIESARQ
ncbi:MAG TPA: PRC-barrel domain-containing protein, partial [Coleofasciculaceae cyanobacterium]